MSVTYWRNVINATLFGKGKCDGSVVLRSGKIRVLADNTVGPWGGGQRGSSGTVHSMQLFKV